MNPPRLSAQTVSPQAKRHIGQILISQGILTEDQLTAWLAKIGGAELVSVDTETTSLDPLTAKLVGISLSVEPGVGAAGIVGNNSVRVGRGDAGALPTSRDGWSSRDGR